MSTPFEQPSYLELLQQVADLHTKVETPITLDDLPLADLRAKLIDNGEPLDLSVLALAGQVADFGAAYPKIRWGVTSFTFAASVAIDGLHVNHGMQSVPTWVYFTAAYADDGHQIVCNLSSVTAPTATQFTFGARDTSGIATSQTHNVGWLAIG